MSFTGSVEASATEPIGAAARSRAETRRRLIEAGTDLFARAGLPRTTTTQIARAAGVAVGTFYLHFPDKHSLFREIAFAALAELRERTSAAHDAAAPDPIDQLRARMETLVAFATEKRDLVRIIFGHGPEAWREAPGPPDHRASPPDPRAGEIGAELADALFPGVEARLRDRAGEGRIDPEIHPAVAAQALVATWIGVVAWWVEDPSRAPREAVVETLVRLHPVFTHADRARAR